MEGLSSIQRTNAGGSSTHPLCGPLLQGLHFLLPIPSWKLASKPHFHPCLLCAFSFPWTEPAGLWLLLCFHGCLLLSYSCHGSCSCGRALSRFHHCSLALLSPKNCSQGLSDASQQNPPLPAVSPGVTARGAGSGNRPHRPHPSSAAK